MDSYNKQPAKNQIINTLPPCVPTPTCVELPKIENHIRYDMVFTIQSILNLFFNKAFFISFSAGFVGLIVAAVAALLVTMIIGKSKEESNMFEKISDWAVCLSSLIISLGNGFCWIALSPGFRNFSMEFLKSIFMKNQIELIQ